MEQDEEQDYETPLRDLESQSGKMEEDLEAQRRDTQEVRSDWEGRQTDTGTPGAQEEGSLSERYGGEDEEPADSDEDEEENEDSEEDGDDEDSDEDAEDDEDETESRGEGATEVEDE